MVPESPSLQQDRNSISWLKTSNQAVYLPGCIYPVMAPLPGATAIRRDSSFR